MAKDPAFLFYTNDFDSGTKFFTDEQVGKYMRVLMAQHQHGHLTLNQVNFICKSYDNDVMSKFEKDSDGRFYNLRLEEEIEKRSNYCKSRGSNKEGKLKGKKSKIISKSYENHMEDENENEIVIKKEVKEIPSLIIFLEHAQEECKKANLNFNDLKYSIQSKYESWVSAGWKDGNGNIIKIWKSKFNNTLPHLKPINNTTKFEAPNPTYTKGKPLQ